MTPTVEPAGVSDKRLAEIARVATNELHFHEKDSTVGVSTTALLSICNELCRARQKLAEMRGALNTAATAFRTGFLPPEDWLARTHELLGLPPTDQKCSQRESGDIRKLRRLLAFAYSEPGALYGDDGELHDASRRPFIDYVRDSVDEIEAAIHERGMQKLIEAGVVKVQLAPTSQPSRGKP